jgi:hypothetical protein
VKTSLCRFVSLMFTYTSLTIMSLMRLKTGRINICYEIDETNFWFSLQLKVKWLPASTVKHFVTTLQQFVSA